jgi:hypothetical protein
MKQNTSLSMVQEIMAEFDVMTGISSGNDPRRYLWTDAFAVCNLIELYRQTDNPEYKRLALRLIDQVHNILGRHRKDDVRKGWISGLNEQEGSLHPTRGGLRIGKQLNERRPDDPVDERLEWDRDGQYYHYLTKWMHALNRAGRVTGDSIYTAWAIELAKTAHAGFTYVPPKGGHKRMYWKMSIDLSYPLVRSMGHHDPLDGFVTYTSIQAAADTLFKESVQPDLNEEIADLAAICEGKDWATDDPLGTGELLRAAYKIAQLVMDGYFRHTELLAMLLDSSIMGLKSCAVENLPAHYRLAFRELGLSIGLHAVERLHTLTEQNPALFNKNRFLHAQIETLMRYMPMHETIEKFWLEDANRKSVIWKEHRDINMVMLATSLAPDGYLTR